jgi:hypothetical protein
MSPTVDSPALDAEQPGEIVGEGVRQEVTSAYVRSPRDVLRLITYAVIALVFLGLTLGVEDAVLAFEEDLVGHRLRRSA